MAARIKERLLYRETYRKGAIRLRTDCLPVLRHVSSDGKPFEAIGCEVTAAGLIEKADGSRVEYQDLRVFMTPGSEG